jgi:acyl-[acyl-carrier-protein]-phospholipid O-acyltransferase / long-chain-fatty-acid--[acyl-carrier-protein] ligase
MKPESRLSASFVWLNVSQFLGALNDNVFKLLVIFFLIGREGPRGMAQADTISAIAGIVFAGPFIVFSALGGVLADRFRKSAVILVMKALEIVVTGLGVWAFFLGHAWMAYVALFLIATQAALFGPSKYGIIPELVHRDEISRANSWLLATTFLAVVLGSALGPFMAEVLKGNAARASIA